MRTSLLSGSSQPATASLRSGTTASLPPTARLSVATVSSVGLFPVVRVGAELLTHASEVAETHRVELEAAEEINGYVAGYERRRAPRSVANYGAGTAG